MDVLQREEPRNARTTGERVLGYPKGNLRALCVSVVNFPWK